MTTDHNPIPIFVSIPTDSGPSLQYVGYLCSTCHVPFLITTLFTDEQIKRFAIRCCHRVCSDCGKDIQKKDPHYINKREKDICKDCYSKNWKEKLRNDEQQAFEKAIKIKYKDWQGEHLYYEDEFYSDLDELLDHCHVTGNYPTYVWDCYDEKLKIDGYETVEAALEEHYEDAINEIGSEKIAELQTLLDKWCDETGIKSYFPDRGRAVLVPEEMIKERKNHE